ncbi:MAG TPA: GNAT family N-acetyltransferase [Allosphingosinicella sp.]
MRIREAVDSDSAAMAALITGLGYAVTPSEISERLALLGSAGEPPLLAEQDDEIVGCVTWHVTPVLHRPGPVGRITMLVVAAPFRGQGTGRALVEAVEARLKERGCVLAEVTSNVKRGRAHRFYERLGFERTSYRFGKPIKQQKQGG